MEYKEQIAKNIIAEVELNGFQEKIDDWEEIKGYFLGTANSTLLEREFWDWVETIAKYVKVRK